jgi:hypothetical protein
MQRCNQKKIEFIKIIFLLGFLAFSLSLKIVDISGDREEEEEKDEIGEYSC